MSDKAQGAPGIGDDVLIALCSSIIVAGGITAGNTVSLYAASRLAALALSHARSPEVLDLTGAATGYPGKTQLCESGLFGTIASTQRERHDEDLDRLAVILAKLFDRL